MKIIVIIFQGMHQFAHWTGRLSDWPGLLGALWVPFAARDYICDDSKDYFDDPDDYFDDSEDYFDDQVDW